MDVVPKAVALKRREYLANKMILKPAMQSFQQKNVLFFLISTTFWDKITSEHITQYLGADFEEHTLFFRDAL